jgi:CheY-like chemotaxis protein
MSNPILPPSEAGPLPARPPGILIAEDEELVRVVLATVFRQHGFAVWPAADGLEAIQIYHQEAASIDLVLLDVRMPGLDGPQTLTALQQVAPNLRCCFMTGAPGLYDVPTLLHLGAREVFAKPFPSLDELVVRVWRLLSSDTV